MSNENEKIQNKEVDQANTEKYEQLIKDLEKEKDEYKDFLQRLQADYENYKKRIDSNMRQAIELANKDLLIEMIDILDTFDIALVNKTEDEGFKKGVELIHAKFIDVLHRNGVKEIDALGKEFDAKYHEVLMQDKTDDESKENIVSEVLQKGYLFGEYVLRPAKVKVYCK